jgi:flagellar motility protein MotE (MotC chaperone)
MIKLLTSSWVTAAVGALIYLTSTALFWKTPKPPPAVKTDTAAAAVHLVGPSWEFSNPEADQLVSELKDERKAVADREQQLNEMAARLEAERAELSQVTQSVRLLQSDFDKSVIHVQADETTNLKKLAKVYSEMDPQTAAEVLGEMDDVAVVKIMIFMKDGETAGILEALAKKGQTQAHRAAMISDRLRLASNRPLPPK